ncbi:putative F-box protein At1g67390 [Eutrema salsugineum]|uniref:putative F-box protein At1g67390 n=1 Tax=Eutrema salsugineum TaxID=72664 RepID=UPI000CECE9F6|nr:putative F-box protein At1g67390 [Eutrema salsugineum]
MKRQSSVDMINANDQISRLPDEVLHKILSKLSIQEAVRTSVLSCRWVDLWKEMPHLFLDLRKLAKFRTLLPHVIDNDTARLMTKVINDHRGGHLERCTIYYYSYQCKNRMVDAWIRSLIHVKHIKHLTLINYLCPFRPNTKPVTLDLPPNSFSHPYLKSLHLGRYHIKTPLSFNNCGNLMNLELTGILAEAGVFNAVLMSCPSLEVLVVIINCDKGRGLLKIENRNLKFLYLSCYKIDGVEVSTPNVDILSIGSLWCERENVVFEHPRLQFHRNYWTTGKIYAHTSYSISCPDQEKKSIGHEFMMSRSQEFLSEFSSMSVSVDLANTKQVEMLHEVLAAWRGEMEELEVLFKKCNAPSAEVETSIGRTKKQFWEVNKPFSDVNFTAYTVWLSDFSGSKQEIAFASWLITQGMVIKTMLIKPSSSFSSKKLEIEGAMANLKELPKGHSELDIIMA